jgi:predicted RNase H-like nuclease (RuvC/YqgF family)
MKTLPVAALILGTAFAAGATRAQRPANVPDKNVQDNPLPQWGAEVSVAEAARRNREQAQAEKTPPRLYTNADIEALGGTIGTPDNGPVERQVETERSQQVESERSQQVEGERSQLEARIAGRDAEEKFWRKRFADLRRDIEDTEKEINILQRELGVASVQYYPQPVVALREQYNREEINGKIGMITEKRLELSILREQLSSLEDQLRRSGGPPSWSR